MADRQASGPDGTRPGDDRAQPWGQPTNTPPPTLPSGGTAALVGAGALAVGGLIAVKVLRGIASALRNRPQTPADALGALAESHKREVAELAKTDPAAAAALKVRREQELSRLRQQLVDSSLAASRAIVRNMNPHSPWCTCCR
ncbi:hypothetical protein [Streptomyces sp. NPDC090445]|uniref:hypothetical protein n=1 Tax=Streptomyces sp. NPDC090445 TaxID=3365963 RepID=UPI00380EDDCA